MASGDLDGIKENRDFLIKQSEMLQSVIKRMADNSLEAKKFGIAAWTAIVGFGFSNRNKNLFILALVSFALFGVLDIYYLYMERMFRKNFNRLVQIIGDYSSSQDNQGQINFLIPIADSLPTEPGVRNAFLRHTKSPFLRQIFSKDSVLKSWANLPYLITFLITIVLYFMPLPALQLK